MTRFAHHLHCLPSLLLAFLAAFPSASHTQPPLHTPNLISKRSFLTGSAPSDHDVQDVLEHKPAQQAVCSKVRLNWFNHTSSFRIHDPPANRANRDHIMWLWVCRVCQQGFAHLFSWARQGPLFQVLPYRSIPRVSFLAGEWFLYEQGVWNNDRWWSLDVRLCDIINPNCITEPNSPSVESCSFK